MKKAYAYIRVSSVKQEDGHGPERQLKAIKAQAKRGRYQLIPGSDGMIYFQDAHTGTEAARPEFLRMLEEAKAAGVRYVLVESMDRFTRNLLVGITLINDLIEAGISLIEATSGENLTDSYVGDPMAEAMVLIKGVFAQAEKRKLVNRMKAARVAVRKTGKRCEGDKPFGTHDGEAEVVNQIRRLRKARMSFAKIADELNRLGTPTRKGGLWGASSVRAILLRPRDLLLAPATVSKC
jgi:DNA invertase Pin-like site-specific DNA recombinase